MRQVLPDLPAAAKGPVDLDEVGGDRALNGYKGVLLIHQCPQGVEDGVEAQQPFLVLFRGGIGCAQSRAWTNSNLSE